MKEVALVLVAYLDESYTAEQFYIGAAVAEKTRWDEVSAGLASVLRGAIAAYGLDPAAELHCSEIMGGRGHWKPLKGKHQEAERIVRDALRVSRLGGVKYIFRGVDVAALRQSQPNPDAPHQIVLKHLLEQLDVHAQQLGAAEPVRVVADTVDTKDELQATFAGYKQYPAAGSQQNYLERIESPILFADSRQHFGLQAIDLAVYLYRRRAAVKNPHPRAKASLERLMKEVDYPTTTHHAYWFPEPRQNEGPATPRGLRQATSRDARSVVGQA